MSDTLTAEETEPWRDTRIVGRGDARRHVAQLKRRERGDILVFGSVRSGTTSWPEALSTSCT